MDHNSKKYKKRVKIDPEDGTKIYLPLGQRFSVVDYLDQIAPAHQIEPTEDQAADEEFFQ